MKQRYFHHFIMLVAVLTILISTASAATLLLPSAAKTIEEEAFLGDTSLDEVILPEGILRIENAAFAQSSVRSINLPETLEYIADDAFEECTIETVEAVAGSYAYAWCVEKELLDDGVLRIRELVPSVREAEEGTAILWNARVTGGTDEKEYRYTIYKDGVEENVVVNPDGAAFWYAPLETGLYTVKLTVTDGEGGKAELSSDEVHVKAYAGGNTPVEQFTWKALNGSEAAITGYTGTDAVVRVPDEVAGYTVTVIGDHVFENNTSIATVFLPDTVKEIGERAFGGCTGLFAADLGDGVTTINERAFEKTGLIQIKLSKNLNFLDDYVFSDCTNLLSINLPASITRVGECVFKECTGLTKVHLPQKLTELNYGMFWKCTSLRSANLPTSITKIHALAFASCTNLTEIQLPPKLTYIGHQAFKNCKNLSSINLPEALKQIEYHAFAYTGLTQIQLPKNLTIINSGMFLNCHNLQSITLPEAVTRIDTRAFEGCTSLIEIQLPKNLKDLWDSAFQGCISLTEIQLPETLTYMASEVFFGCENLRSIRLPASIKEIRNYAFKSCKNLTQIQLSENLISMGREVFFGCENLTSLDLPNSLTSIGEDCFLNCPNLKLNCEYGSYAFQYAMENNLAASYLALTDGSLPSGMFCLGDAYSVTGMIRSSHPITAVTTQLLGADGATLIRTGTAKIDNGYTISARLTVDPFVTVESLIPGNYTYKILATIGGEEKTVAASSFTVAEPPLRLILEEGSIPNGVYELNASFPLAGTIRSNYPITEITAGIYDQNGVPTEQVATVYPNTTTYRLALLAHTAQINTLADGKYSYQIKVVSNGQTRSLVTSYFGIGSVNGEGITSIELDQMKVFGSNLDNKSIFSLLTYHNDYLNSLSLWDAFKVAIVSGRDIVSSSIGDLLAGTERNSYAVDLYKQQIVSAIEDQIKAGYTGHEDVKINKIAADWLASSAEIIDDGFSDYMASIQADYSEIKDAFNLVNYDFALPAATYAGMLQMAEIVDGLKIISSVSSHVEDFSKILEIVFRDYEAGSIVIHSVSEVLGLSGNPNFDEAMSQVRTEYDLNFIGVVRELLEEAKDKMGKEMISGILEMVGKRTYKVYDLAIDIAFKLTGFEEYTDNIMKFTTATEAFNHSKVAYRTAFDHVYQGDQSEEALRQLLICFKFTYSCAENLYDTLYDLSSASKKQEVLDHINAYLEPISIWNTGDNEGSKGGGA